MTTVEDAFRWARIHAVRHMAACEQAGIRWGETAITEVVTSRAAEAVEVVPFTQRAEALAGADWIWWWLDSSSAYGMLVQAKRLAVTSGKWRFGFDYRNGKVAQRDILLSIASRLGLLPVYALYLGTGDYRMWQSCPDGHMSGRCLHCVKRSVSLMPGLLAEEKLVDNAGTTYERSVALEDMWRSQKAGAPLIPGLARQVTPDLEHFLKKPQEGTRAITRSMIDRVLLARSGSFSAAPKTAARPLRTGDHDQLGPVFDSFPDDSGHWGLNYFEHVISPLRHAPPDYVLEIASGEFDARALASDMPGNVSGIVVVRTPQAG